MNISAALTADEVALLSDPERSLEETARTFKPATGSEHQPPDESDFEHSLRLKNTLDVFEKEAVATPTWQRLSTLLNCEHRLYILNESTPLRLNPFLSHWVEAIQRLATDAPDSSGRSSANQGALRGADIGTTRAELIKSLLKGNDRQHVASSSPRQLYQEHVEHGQPTPFDIGPYIRMLEEEGIYERASTSEDKDDSVAPQPEKFDTPTQDSRSSSHRQDWRQKILTRLDHEPESAISDLTRLPIELASLDFLTTLLQDQTLQRLSIEPAPIIHDFLQHGLRLIEQMGQPIDASMANSFATVSNGVFDAVDDEIDHGRGAQTRAVKLLLLFIRNLVRKALVPIEAIYFEIQEICVRYVWIREVREFRSFLEEGVEGEEI